MRQRRAESLRVIVDKAGARAELPGVQEVVQNW